MLKITIAIIVVGLLIVGAWIGWHYYSILYATDYDQMLAKLYSNTVPVVKSSDLKDWKTKQNLIILDTREPNESGVSQIEGALVVGYNKVDWSKIDSLNPNDTIVVYCSVGYRSERIGEQLLKKGFKHVYNLYGGIFDWVNNGYPVYLANEQTSKVHGYSKTWGKWLTKGEKVYD